MRIHIPTVPPSSMQRLKAMHERAVGGMLYINRHPTSAYAQAVRHNLDRYFDRIEDHIPHVTVYHEKP